MTALSASLGTLHFLEGSTMDENMLAALGQMQNFAVAQTIDQLGQPAVVRGLARFTRAYFEALVAEGFTREEAFQLANAHGWPGLGRAAR